MTDHASRVRSTLQVEFKNVLDHSEIDDALSQATHRLWKARTRIDLSKGTLRAWYYSIARNCSLRLLTGKGGPNALRFSGDLDRLPVRAPIAPDRPAPDAHRVLYAAIDKLRGQQREVLLADLAAGGTADTKLLMAQLNTSQAAIYVARTNGRKALRKILTAMGYPPKTDENGEDGGELS